MTDTRDGVRLGRRAAVKKGVKGRDEKHVLACLPSSRMAGVLLLGPEVYWNPVAVPPVWLSDSMRSSTSRDWMSEMLKPAQHKEAWLSTLSTIIMLDRRDSRRNEPTPTPSPSTSFFTFKTILPPLDTAVRDL